MPEGTRTIKRSTEEMGDHGSIETKLLMFGFVRWNLWSCTSVVCGESLGGGSKIRYRFEA